MINLLTSNHLPGAIGKLHVLDYASNVVISPSVSRWTTSRTPIVSGSKDFCEVVRLLKMMSSLYQADSNIEQAILWISFIRLIFGVFRGQHGELDIISWLSDGFSILIINFSEPFLQGYVALLINLKQANNSDS